MSTTAAFLDHYVFDPDVEPPQEQGIYEGLLSKNDLAVWVGREKHRKTNVVLQFAICAAIGRSFLNFPFVAPQPLKIVYVDYESKSHSLWVRYQAICHSMNLTDVERQGLKDHLRIIEVRKIRKTGLTFPRFPVKLKNNEDEKANEFWLKFVNEYPADLYIFDPLSSTVGSEAWNSRDLKSRPH